MGLHQPATGVAPREQIGVQGNDWTFKVAGGSQERAIRSELTRKGDGLLSLAGDAIPVWWSRVCGRCGHATRENVRR